MRSLLKLVALFVALAGGSAWAQTIHWEPGSGTFGVGQASELQLVFDGCSVDNPPAVPKVDGFTMQYGGRSSTTSMYNGSFSSSVILTYGVLLSEHHPVDIPSFTVETNKGKVTVASAHFEAGEATVGTSGLSVDQVASARLSTSPISVWAGQVFDLAYSIDVDETYFPEFQEGFSWDPAPLAIEDWAEPEKFEARSGATTHEGRAYKTRAVAHASGQLQLSKTHQLVNLRVGVTGFGFFQQRQIQQFAITGSAPSLEVKPLPPAPAGFTGAVGQFRITSKVVPQSVAVGDPITWTIELKGTGNWPDIQGLPSRRVSKDFQVVQPKAKRTPAPGKLFDATLSEDVVLIPTRSGTYTLDPVVFTYFDPKKGSYEELQTPPVTVTVTPGAAAPVPPAGTTATPASTPNAPAAQRPEAPAAIPKDPFIGSVSADAPLKPIAVGLAACGLFALVPLTWGIFAYRRAKRTDPSLSRRQAKARAEAAIAAIEGADSSQRPTLLRVWQRECGILLNLASAAPAAADLADAAWAQVWSEADRAIYGAEQLLPADWPSRARTVLTLTPVPPFSAGQLFRGRNLFPFALAVCLILGAGQSLSAEEGGALYRGAEFAKAEAAWKETLANHPLDWHARYNLSLALAQQDHWGEAAAQASAAFVQHPSDPTVRWQFALACDKAGFTPTVIGDFLQPSPAESFARLQSAPEWQRLLLLGVFLFCLGLGLLLASAYGALAPRVTQLIALIVIALGLGLGAVSFGGIRAYGLAAESRAVMVWRASTLRSVPTEAEVSQKTSSLGAGSIAVIDGSFLSWVKLRFDSGETGWVRSSEVIPLWQ